MNTTLGTRSERPAKRMIRAAVVVALLTTGTGAMVAPTATATTMQRCNTATPAPWWHSLLLPTYNGNRSIPCYVPYGSSGAAVKAVQQYAAVVTGTSVRIDGQYGPATRAAVKTIQSNLNACLPSSMARFTEDGLWGYQMWDRLVGPREQPYGCGD